MGHSVSVMGNGQRRGKQLHKVPACSIALKTESILCKHEVHVFQRQGESVNLIGLRLIIIDPLVRLEM